MNEDLVECKLCHAILDRNTRPFHIEWHAKLRATLHTLTEAIKELESRHPNT
jgi:hypothetical protein